MADQKTSEDQVLPDGFKPTELGPLPEEWEVVQLVDVLDQVNVRVDDYDDSKAQGFPVLSLTKNQGLILQSERFEKRIALKDVSKYKVVRRGQIVYNPYVIWEGAVHMLRHFEYGLVSPVYPVWQVLPDKADSFFIDQLLRMPIAIAAYNRFASGAVNRRRSIRQRDFLSIQIPLPPLPEQRAIAQVLRTVQRAKEATERVITASRELKRSLMRHLFTYGPVPLDQAEQVPLKETEIGPLPAPWEVVPLGDVLRTTQYGLSVRANPNGTYPMLRMNNLIDGRIDTTDLKYVELEEDDLRKFALHKGDVLFNRTNSHELVGKTSIFDAEGEFVFASYLIRTIPDPGKLMPEYLNYYLNWDDSQSRLRMTATRGVSQSNISAAKLKRFEIALPPIDVQAESVRILSAVERRIEMEETRKAALEGLFKTLLPHLMTGQVRVGEVEV